MKIAIKNVLVDNNKVDILIENEKVAFIGKLDNAIAVDRTIEAEGLTALPAFIDMHVHLREPGQEGKETIATGTKAAVAGGYASVCCMPNTNPTIDNPYIVKYVLDRAKEADNCKVYPIGAISVGLKGEKLAPMGKMKDAGAIAMSDDGQPVTTAQMMRLALEYAKDFDLLLMSHCEDKSLVNGGVMNEGYNSTKMGLKGIPSAAEDVMLIREIVLAEMLNTKVHICHVSTKSGVQLVREAKARGVKVSCETCPHYIAGTDDLVLGYNTMAKVNPPMREEKDRQAIIQGLVDGTIDVISTDHAPHKMEDKICEFDLAANGISGSETAFSLCYTELVDKGYMDLKRLSELMTTRAASLLGIECGELKEGGHADITLVDLNETYKIDASKFYSKGHNTPFDGREVKGKVKYTIVDGKIKFEA